MNELQKVFQYSGQQVRTVVEGEEIWFVAKDVCEVLEIKQPTKAVERLDEDEVNSIHVTDSIGRKQETIIISESGLYDLVLGSRKVEAKEFKRWVKKEVLPSIRKTGSYTLKVPQSFSEALRLAADLQEKIEQDKPKVEAHDRFISGDNFQKMNEVAKIVGIGRNKLFKFLREQKILMADNTPYQRFIDAGHFVVKEKPIQMGGQMINKPQTFATAKGISYIDRLLNHQKEA